VHNPFGLDGIEDDGADGLPTGTLGGVALRAKALARRSSRRVSTLACTHA
jgi:hypothetical protein